MKKHDFGKPLCRLIMAVAMMMLSLQAMAYEFSYTHQGKTLYYNITSENTVEVTYYSSSSNNYVSGDVVIPSTVMTYSVTSIGDSAFRGCSGLTSVTIPNGVTSIGEKAFEGCSGLTSVRCLATDPPSIGSSSFSGISSTCTLAVSCVSLDAYIGSDWNTYFGGRILGDSTEEFPFELTASANDLTTGSVDISIGERCD